MNQAMSKGAEMIPREKFGWLRMLGLAATCIVIVGSSNSANAIGEIFALETKGTEYCGHFDFGKFNKKNDVPMWVRVDSENQITVSLTAGFDNGTTFPMFGFFYQTKNNASAFIGGVEFLDGAFATIQGTAKIEKGGVSITSMKGTFVQSGIVWDGCFSSGKFKTGRRLN